MYSDGYRYGWCILEPREDDVWIGHRPEQRDEDQQKKA